MSRIVCPLTHLEHFLATKCKDYKDNGEGNHRFTLHSDSENMTITVDYNFVDGKTTVEVTEDGSEEYHSSIGREFDARRLYTDGKELSCKYLMDIADEYSRKFLDFSVAQEFAGVSGDIAVSKGKMIPSQVEASYNGRYLTVDKAIELLLDYKKKYSGGDILEIQAYPKDRIPSAMVDFAVYDIDHEDGPWCTVYAETYKMNETPYYKDNITL